MKLTLDHFAEKLEKISVYVIGGLTGIFACFLSLVSLLHTTSVENITQGNGINTSLYHILESIESVIFRHDSFLWNMILLAASLCLCFLLLNRKKQLSMKTICIGLFLWTVLFGTIWVFSSQSSPSEDSYIVSSAAAECAKGNPFTLADGNYFKNYSFQLGFVFFLEIIMRIANAMFYPGNLLYLEFINVLCLGVINVNIVRINDLLFEDKRIAKLSAVLLAFSAAPLVSCSFIYGIIPGMMFAILALYHELCYFKKKKAVSAVKSVFCIALAMLVKPNYLIWLIAMMLLAFVMLFRRKRFVKDIAYMVAAVSLASLMQPAVKSMYEKRCGADLGEPVPYVSWIAMGLNESANAPGWYNYAYTLTNFGNSDCNAEVASSKSKAVIRDRIRYFVRNPQYAHDFMYGKIVSQWNETSYESIWNNQVRRQYKPKGRIAAFVCDRGVTAAKRYMDIFAQLIFFGFAISCVLLLRKKEFLLTPFPLIFLGGFFYQLISEGKSQYILPYFILMTGFAAFGIVRLYEWFLAKAKEKNHKRILQFFGN